jgi:RNA polymerase sigma-70 factor (ECF subfamily)
MLRPPGRILQREGAVILRVTVNATTAVKPASEPSTVGRELPDSEATFERAYESEFPRVYGYVRYRVGDRDTADDLTSQAFLRALDRLSTFDPGRAPFPAWLLGIARNVVRDHLRARRRWGWLSLGWLRERASSDPTPEQAAIRGEQEQQLLAALGGLSERERDVLGLKFAGGLTNRAIARLIRLSESHVGVIVYRAVGKLRTRLGGEEVRRA